MFFTPLETKDCQFAKEAGGHNFKVVKRKMYFGEKRKVPDKVAMVARTNTGRKITETYLGTVGPGFEPVQPEVLWDLAGELISSTNGFINGVFKLRGGSVIGISFNLAKREYVKGDPVDLNFIMLNAFDGTKGLAGHGNISRVVCLNQCNTSNKVYNLRHTKNVLNRVVVVKNMLRYYDNEIVSFDNKMTKLVGTRISEDNAVNWFRSLLDDSTSKRTSKRATTTLDNATKVFLDCLLNGRGSEIPGVKGTRYGAFQALTEYINHHRKTRLHSEREEGEVRFEAIHFGSGNTLAQKGLKILTAPKLELAA